MPTMAVEGNGDVSACGRENLGIVDLGSFRDDVTQASVSVDEDVETLSEGEDIMVGVSGAEIFFEGIYGPEEQEEDAVVREEEEDDFNNYEICIDETLEIKDYGVFEVQESAGAAEAEEIVSCVRALVQSLPLPGQISPHELIPVDPQLVSSRDIVEKNAYDEFFNQPAPVLKRKRESIGVQPRECGVSSKKHTYVSSCSSMPSLFQEFEEFLNASTNVSTVEDKMISRVEIPVQMREDDQNENSPKELHDQSKTELPGYSGCESSLVDPVKEIKDSYWPDMVIQTETPGNLPAADTITISRGYKGCDPQPTRLGPDHPNKCSRMKTLKYNHVPVAATTDKNSPAELILTFDNMQAIPSESKLNNIFRRFGALKETETLIYQGYARVLFKKSSDAEVAVSSARAFNIMGPSVVKYELGYAPLTAMPAADVDNTHFFMPSAESEVINARGYELEEANARECAPELVNAQKFDHEDMPSQQMQFERLEETFEVDITVESEEYEGLDDVDIME